MDPRKILEELRAAYNWASWINKIQFKDWHYEIYYAQRCFRVPQWEVDFEYEDSDRPGITKEKILQEIIIRECQAIDNNCQLKIGWDGVYTQWARGIRTDVGFNHIDISWEGKEIEAPIVVEILTDDRVFVWYSGLYLLLSSKAKNKDVEKALMSMGEDLKILERLG